MFISRHTFYEKHTGEKHEAVITYDFSNKYQVTLDGEFYSNHESNRQAIDEVIDIRKLHDHDWTVICPV